MHLHRAQHSFVSLIKLLAWTLFFLSRPLYAAAPEWTRVDIGIIGPASASVLDSALKQAVDMQHQGLLVVLDTPGGGVNSTRPMVKTIMSSPIPVLIWVGPSGARAASAGAFITLAGHISSMAKGTNIGAATPIQASGQDLEEKSDAAQKQLNDLIAFIQSIAEERGRNVDMAKSFVTQATSITAEQAVDYDIIDYVAAYPADALKQAHARTITLQSGETIEVQSDNAQLTTYKYTLAQSFLDIISNPNLFYLLLLAGMIGLGFELTNPGALFPGVAGGICMILALIATAVLPVNFGSMALIFVGLALLVAEAFLPSFGILGIGGITAFLLGSIFLIDTADYGVGVSLWTILPGTAAIAGSASLAGYLIIKAERRKTETGSALVLEQTAEALEDFDVHGQGKVRVAGEIWTATVLSDHPLSPPKVLRHQMLKVVKTEGLKVWVAPVPDELGKV